MNVKKEIKKSQKKITKVKVFKATSPDVKQTAIKLLKQVIDGNQLNPFDDTLKAKICRFLYKTTKDKKYNRF